MYCRPNDNAVSHMYGYYDIEAIVMTTMCGCIITVVDRVYMITKNKLCYNKVKGNSGWQFDRL